MSVTTPSLSPSQNSIITQIESTLSTSSLQISNHYNPNQTQNPTPNLNRNHLIGGGRGMSRTHGRLLCGGEARRRPPFLIVTARRRNGAAKRARREKVKFVAPLRTPPPSSAGRKTTPPNRNETLLLTATTTSCYCNISGYLIGNSSNVVYCVENNDIKRNTL